MNNESMARVIREYLSDLWQTLADRLDATRPPDRSASPSGGQHSGRRLILYLLLILSAIYLARGYRDMAADEIAYSEFLELVDKGKVERAVVTEQFITGTVRPSASGEPARKFVTVPLWNQELAEALRAKGVEYTVRDGGNWLGNFIVNWLLPLGLLLVFWGWMARRMTGNRGFLSLGKDRIRIQADSAPKVTFKDVAGAAEAKQELKETIEFLQEPSRIQRLGGRMPRIVSPFFAKPEMGPSDFRSKKLATRFAFGSPRSSCVSHGCAGLCATRSAMASTNDLTPCRWPSVLSPPALPRGLRQNCRPYGYAGVVVHRSSAAAPSTSVYSFRDAPGRDLLE